METIKTKSCRDWELPKDSGDEFRNIAPPVNKATEPTALERGAIFLATRVAAMEAERKALLAQIADLQAEVERLRAHKVEPRAIIPIV